MDFTPDPRTEQFRDELLTFMDSYVYPAEPVFQEQVASAENRWDRPPVMAELTRAARERGLWNLFLPDGRYGPGLSHAQYAPLAEITGRSPMIAPEALNCAAPDTGNMELLAIAADEQQREEWLLPLLDARIRSAFCMTEPDVASSDAANIQTAITSHRDGYRITGRKWWSTGALAPQCRLLIVMGVSDPDAPPHRRQSIVLVPRDTPGVHVVRGLDVFGFDDGAHGGHAEIVFDDVHIPAANLLGDRGAGFALAQARLGAGRIHHCMRLVGMAERAFELMCTRAQARVAFGKPLAEQGQIRHWIANSRVRLEQLRLLVLKTAWMMDTVGAKAARTEISAIKIAAPSTAQWVIDKAIQVHGGAGVSQDLPLAMLWTHARYLRLADGPDEVHRDALARHELRSRN